MRSLFKPIGLTFLAVVALNGLFLWSFPDERERLRIAVSTLLDDDERGFLYKTYVDAFGRTHPYCVFVPFALKDADRRPLIVYLNGAGENGGDGLKPLINGLAPAIWETKRDFPFVVAFPQCPQGDSWTAGGEATQLAMAILKRTAEEYHTDPDRVILTGISSGGAGTWSIAARYPERFAAIVPISSHGVSDDDAQTIVEAGLPVWNFYVGEDEPALVKGSRQSHQKLLELGASPRSTELRTSTHDAGPHKHDAWSFAFHNPALIDWMWRQRRSADDADDHVFQLVRFDAHLLPKPSEVDELTWSITSDGYELQTRLLRPGKVLLPTQIVLGGPGEVHVAFRPREGTRRCGMGWIRAGDTALHEGAFVELAVDDMSCGGYYDAATGRCLTPADPISEHALVLNEWNDLRIRRDAGTIHAELNGWPLFEAPAAVASSDDGRLTLFIAGEQGAAVDWRYLRVQGTTFSEVLPGATAHLFRRPRVEGVRLQEVVSAWRRRANASPGFRLEFAQQRQGIHRWGRFRSAVALPDDFDAAATSEVCYSSEGEVVVSTPWWYPNTRISRRHGLVGEIFENGFFELQRRKFPDPDDQRCSLSMYRSVRTPDARFDWVSDGGDDQRGIVLRPQAPVERQSPQFEEWYIQGILTALRPLDRSGGSVDVKRCRVLSEGAVVGGHECLVVEEESGNEHSDGKRRFFVDPKRHFAILRVAELHAGRLTRQVDVHYATTTPDDLRLESWSVVSIPSADTSSIIRSYPGKETLIESAAAELVDLEYGVEAPGNFLQHQFPVGTTYFDQRDGQWYVAGENGPRPMDPERITLYATGAKLPLHSSWLSRTILAAIGLAILSVLIIRRRWRSEPIANLAEADEPPAV